VPLKVHPNVVPLNNGCYLFLQGSMLAVYPATEDQQADLTLPGHGTSSYRSIILVKGGIKIGVGLRPETVVGRYVKATHIAERQGRHKE
jgi:hypothetical protein